jgi:hypothetical protein
MGIMKKNDFFRGISLVLSVTMCFFSVTPSYAYDPVSMDQGTMWEMPVEEQSTETQDDGDIMPSSLEFLISGEGPLVPSDPPDILPFIAEASTSTNGRKNLKVEIAENQNATVTWNNQSHQGHYDIQTGTIVIDVPVQDYQKSYMVSNEWTVTIGESQGQALLESFENRYVYTYNNQDQKNIYEFDPAGLLSKTIYESQSDSYSSRSEHTYEYVTLGTELRVGANSSSGYSRSIRPEGEYYYEYESESTTDYIVLEDGRILTAGYTSIGENRSEENGEIRVSKYKNKSFYEYDEEGLSLGSAYVYQNETGGMISASGGYNIRDAAAKERRSAYVNYAEGSWLFDQIAGFDGAEEIFDRLAVTKRIDYYSAAQMNWNERIYSIEFEHALQDMGDEWIARRVDMPWDPATYESKSYIVVGQADVVSTENDDILFKNWQQVEDYYVSYGAAHEYKDEGIYLSMTADNYGGAPAYLGYGLIFSKWVMDGDGNWTQEMAVVDYPESNTVTLGGVEYTITIDDQGLIVLDDGSLQH